MYGVDVTQPDRIAVLLEANTQTLRVDQKQTAFDVVLVRFKLTLARSCHSSGSELFQQHWPDFPEIFAQELSGNFTNWYLPVFATFALHDTQDAVLQVEVIRCQATEFTAAQGWLGEVPPEGHYR